MSDVIKIGAVILLVLMPILMVAFYLSILWWVDRRVQSWVYRKLDELDLDQRDKIRRR